MTKQNPHTQNAEVDMNPMLDIVFILLIFFIVTTSFNRPTALDLNRVKENKPSLSQTVTPQFQITNDNQILLNNKVIDAQSIAINLARLDANGEITAISVAADKESTHNTLVHLLNEIKGYTSAPVSLGNLR
ncbi:ExbD/TolR family protein [Pseudoalteromonas piratica]|uniref:Biopolymer transporter n=1 Tax=Pseudoalteromonas piratica TaxID=1348114 RepID=A0A0A7EKR2_9GAMM|nr:biopolymer transporter ExbD [Pseudoalteromonas piratica]AIY67285.1 biopolymer transporter [Pseudoalteromonas piratica]